MVWTALTAPGAAVGPAALFAPDPAVEPAPARPVRNSQNNTMMATRAINAATAIPAIAPTPRPKNT